MLIWRHIVEAIAPFNKPSSFSLYFKLFIQVNSTPKDCSKSHWSNWILLSDQHLISNHWYCRRLWENMCDFVSSWVEKLLVMMMNRSGLSGERLHYQPCTAPGSPTFNSQRPRQNGRHFADDILKCIFLNENVCIPNKISLKFVPKGPINNNPALVQVMAWRRPGDKPLSEPMMVRLQMHICVTRPRWVNSQRLRQNGRHLVDNPFKHIFLNDTVQISIKSSHTEVCS